MSVTNKTHSTQTASNVKPLDIDDPRHGTLNGYNTLKCRCDNCRAAKAAYQIDYKRPYKRLAADDPRHGTYNGYSNLKCRCADCRAANAVRQIDYYSRYPEQREKYRIQKRERTKQRRLEKAKVTI